MNTNELKQVLDSYISTRNNGNLKAYVEILSETYYNKYQEENEKLPYYINIIDEIRANENGHTRLLVKLFNYKDKNGIRIIIKSFLNFFNINTNHIEITNESHFNMTCKVEGRNRYADISFYQKTADNKSIGVIIENKINGAEDQEDQVDDYITDLIMNKHINAENIYIFYLINQIDKNSPKQKPLLKTNDDYNEGKKLEKNYSLITYKNHILPWLKEKLLPSIVYKEKDLIDNINVYISYLKNRFGMIDDKTKLQLNLLYNTSQIKDLDIIYLFRLDSYIDKLFEDFLKEKFSEFQETKNQFILVSDQNQDKNIKLEFFKDSIIKITLHCNKKKEMLQDIYSLENGGYYKVLEVFNFNEIEKALLKFKELRNDVSIKNWIGNKFDFKLEESYIERIRNIITLQSAINTLILDKMKNYMTIFSQICKSKGLNAEKEYSSSDFSRSYYRSICENIGLSLWCELNIQADKYDEISVTIGLAFTNDNIKEKEFLSIKNQINEILEKVRNKGFNEDSDDGYVISYRFHEKEIIENNTIGEYPLNNILTKLPDLIDSLYNKSDKVLNGTI